MANAFAVDANVNEGTMISSPGRRSSSKAAISSACVPEVVMAQRRAPPTSCSIQAAQRDAK